MEEEQFIHMVAEQLNVDSEQAKKIISAVFHALHDRLTPKEATHVAAQMPSHLKSMWVAFELPGREVKRTHKTQFVRHIAEQAGIAEDEATRAMRVVFKALQALLKSPTGQEGEAWDIFSQLPKDLKRVWLAAGTATPKPRRVAEPR
jgi:uncharacterized protein (DUF2267 family)